MKILVVGLDCAAPELMFGDDRLVNLRRLMEAGCHGNLESITPPITVPAWMCMATSQDPGSLGVYGFRNRVDHSYAGLGYVHAKSITELTVWDQVAREGKRAVIIGVPPNYPPRKVNGVSIGCFLTPDSRRASFTHPPALQEQITGLVGDYPFDVKEFRTPRKDWLKEQIYSMSRKHFEVVRYLLQHAEWDCFQFVEIGLDRLQHGFWKFHDPQHVLHEPGNPYQDVIRDYYRQLDDELGQTFALLNEDTAILVLSDHGARRLDGGFCVNEWLIREGLLVLDDYPKKVTPFEQLPVNWRKTRVWSEGGYYARVFFNVKGREPDGVIDPQDYEKVRDDVKARLEATLDEKGKPLGTLVFKPEEIYRTVRNVAPDLIVHFGGLAWRSIGGVGYRAMHIQENDTGPDDCNHAQVGSFILAASNSPLTGPIEGAHLLDMAPTLLDLGGYDTPASMQGKSLLSRQASGIAEVVPDAAISEQECIRARLSGLGYIS